MSSTSSSKTIDVLRQIFSVFGLPEQVVTDNGPQFVSEEFSTFLRNNGIRHFKSAPYHPSTNGAAERLVQTFKNAIKKGKQDGLSSQHSLSNFLLRYRSIPHSTTGRPPCELMLKRSLRTRLDLLKPNQESNVLNQQANQKYNHDSHSRSRIFIVGQNVMVRSYRNSDPKWIPGIIL